MDKFIIGIGGTGMRCLEAFTHLCAMGMLDNEEINILSIDTDTNNGNKSRTDQLIEKYNRIKNGSEPTYNTFFSSKINHFRFAPEYSGQNATFKEISHLHAGNEKIRKENNTLAKLLFEEDVQDFRLDQGYRAQTHLGSHLMYHTILEAVRKYNDGSGRKEDKDLSLFLNKIYDAGDSARVFILGSIFGGTGASSIPVIPQALADAIRLKDNTLQISKKAKFGCVLLSKYFLFNKPKKTQIIKDRVIADPDKFDLNSQAALMFYEMDATVQRIYNRMYHIGWPVKPIDYDENSRNKETTLGGAEQKNPAHVVELLSACAAYDFLTSESINTEDHEILYKSAEFVHDKYNFDFRDFFGPGDYKKFMQKLSAFYALNFLIHLEDGDIRHFSNKLAEKYGINEYQNLSAEITKDINTYIKWFGFDWENQKVIPGWLQQVQNSTLNPVFLFDSPAFSTDFKTLTNFNWGKLFLDKVYNFKGSILNLHNPYDMFRKQFIEDKSFPQKKQNIGTLAELFLAHIHNTFSILYNFQ